MKIEILYFRGCPNHLPAVTRVEEALSRERVRAETVQVEVADEARAQALGFLGSPSIRINGQDIEPSARTSREFGLCCRNYGDPGGRQAGVPPLEWIRAAVREAKGAV